ncbi:neurotrypsin-like [Patiria miniata]|uniref:Peptidase S1 domain-containing protein n=1 Tax=Patiria miniata TaxID=46514 RepID=A0A914AA69_PATMI|nr:neurotrypsin-like [Patiria miniata]
MVRGPLGLIPHRSPTCGLVILISIYCTGLASAWRGDDGNTSPGLLRDPPSPMEAEVSSGYSQPNTHNDPPNRKPPSFPHQPSAYNIMQHALWDEKMADDAGDTGGYEARKWSYLQDRVNDNYVQRTIDYLLNGIEVDADEHLREEGHGLDSRSIGVQRRSSLPDTCGRRDIEPEVTKRVVLGRKARVGQWPWLVQLSEIGATQPYCGGTLLSDEFVLTAAHCFDRHDPNDVVVIIGDWNRLAKEGTEQRFRVDCVYIHEAYIPRGDYKDDVALVRLKTDKRKVKMGPAVQPVCLPPQQRAGEPDLFKSGDMCFVVGWGFTDPLTYFNSQHPAILHEARLPILPPQSCRDAYGGLYTDNMVCAGHMTGDHRTDACKGDSGGPLMCREKTGHWVVWGIVSWGHNYFCNGSPHKPIPTVYTKVEEYLPWLMQRLRLDKC